MLDSIGTRINIGDTVVFNESTFSDGCLRLNKGTITRMSKANVWIKLGEWDQQRKPNRVIVIEEVV